MFLRRASHRTAARLSAATQPQVCALLEPLENRRLLSAAIKGSYGVVLESTGKPVALDYDANQNVVLQRFYANGFVLDTTFGVGGQVAVPISAFGLNGHSDIAIGAGDRLAVSSADRVFVFNGDGAPDASFGNGGSITVPGGETVAAVAIQPDGKVVVGANTDEAITPAGGFVMRYNADGTLDASFGTGGTLMLPAPASTAYPVKDLIVEKNGDIAVVGAGADGGAYIAQVTPGGTIAWSTDTSPSAQGSYDAVAEAPDGSLVAVGSAEDPQRLVPSLMARYLPGDGALVFANVAGGGQEVFEGVGVTSDGKIIAVGRQGLGTNSIFAERYDLNGQFDATFNNGHEAVLTSSLGADHAQVAVASDGSAYVSGTEYWVDQPGNTDNSAALLAHLSPTGSTAPVAGGTLQAEGYDQGGEGVGYHDTDAVNEGGAYRPADGVDIQAGGTGFNVGWTHAGEWLDYTVNATSTGTYSMDLSLANVGSGATFHVEVDGVAVTGSIAVPDTGDFQSYKSVRAGAIKLTAGQHTIKVVFDSNSQYGYAGNFDSFSLSALTTVFPNGVPYNGQVFQTGNVVEAENFNAGNEGGAYHDTDPQNLGGQYRPNDGVDIESTGDAGGGYDVGWTHTGEFLNYYGDVATVGNYDFVARVANVGSGGSFHVSVNGVDVSGPIAIPDTGGFQNYTTVTARLTVPLAAGTVQLFTITFDGQAASGYSGNLNWFKLQPSAVMSQPYGGTPASLPGAVQAENFDTGGEGIAYHDLDAQNIPGAYRPTEGVDVEAGGSGNVVSWTHAGEWLQYTVNAGEVKDYTFSALVSNDSLGGAFHVTVDGVDVSGEMAVPDTGSWQKYDPVTKSGIRLTAGTHVVRVYWDGNNACGFSGNMDWFAFV